MARYSIKLNKSSCGDSRQCPRRALLLGLARWWRLWASFCRKMPPRPQNKRQSNRAIGSLELIYQTSLCTREACQATSLSWGTAMVRAVASRSSKGRSWRRPCHSTCCSRTLRTIQITATSTSSTQKPLLLQTIDRRRSMRWRAWRIIYQVEAAPSRTTLTKVLIRTGTGGTWFCQRRRTKQRTLLAWTAWIATEKKNWKKSLRRRHAGCENTTESKNYWQWTKWVRDLSSTRRSEASKSWLRNHRKTSSTRISSRRS